MMSLEEDGATFGTAILFISNVGVVVQQLTVELEILVEGDLVASLRHLNADEHTYALAAFRTDWHLLSPT
jgi:hypothetical protein